MNAEWNRRINEWMKEIRKDKWRMKQKSEERSEGVNKEGWMKHETEVNEWMNE